MKKYQIQIKRVIVVRSFHIWMGIKRLGLDFKRESRETKEASRILIRIIKGKMVSSEEVKFLKGQSFDIGKALTVIGLQAIPGSSFAIIAIEKAGQHYGFTLFPQEQKMSHQYEVEEKVLVDELDEEAHSV